MPKNQVSDLITDQEMAFARLVLSGTLNDRDAAQAAGLNPDTAAYTKAKPRVRAYMLEHRAAVEKLLVAQETEGLRQLNLGRDQILRRLWEMANISPQMTRGSMSVQFKALSMIVAMEGLLSDRRAGASSSAKQQEKAIQPEPSPALDQEEEEPGLAKPEPEPAATTGLDPIESAFAIPFSYSEAATTAYAPLFASAPKRSNFSELYENRGHAAPLHAIKHAMQV